MNNGVEIPIEMIIDRRLTLIETRVLIALYSFKLTPDPVIWPSRTKLSQRCGYSYSRISNATNRLCQLGWLSKIRQNPRAKTTQYTLLLPDIFAEKKPDFQLKLALQIAPENPLKKASKKVPDSGKNDPVDNFTDMPESSTSIASKCAGVPSSGTVPELGTSKVPSSGTVPKPSNEDLKRRKKECANEENLHTHKTGDFSAKNEPPGFVEFWGHYRIRKKRKECLKKWLARDLESKASQINRDVVEKQHSDADWLAGFQPHPLTYINGDLWDDEIKTRRNTGRARHDPHIDLMDTSWAEINNDVKI